MSDVIQVLRRAKIKGIANSFNITIFTKESWLKIQQVSKPFWKFIFISCGGNKLSSTKKNICFRPSLPKGRFCTVFLVANGGNVIFSVPS